MLFNSFTFLLFFLFVTPVYYLLPSSRRWIFLLLASAFFYAFFIPAYLLILLAVILIDYTTARLIEPAAGSRRKALLSISLIANLGILAVFKYYNFFAENINTLLAALPAHPSPLPLWSVILPIGLSFHTFQAMSYTIEVYRGHQPAEKKLGVYALYVLFYPQLVAGPIERPQHLLPQLRQYHPPDYEQIGYSLKKMAWGFFLKLVVADRLAIFVNHIFAHPEIHSRLALLTAVFFYSFQIYCDFAGYSLIAIGAAGTLGIRLSENFRQPYLASSLASFWNRWHMTLYSWFRDYLYIPLGGNRVGIPRYILNIFITFLLSGLWHGASWTFVIWGLLHATLLLLESGWNRLLPGSNRNRIFHTLFCFILVSLCWIFFRAPSLSEAFTIFHRIFGPDIPWLIAGEFRERAILLYSLFGIGSVLIFDIREKFSGSYPTPAWQKKTGARLAACIALVVTILLIGVFDGSQFIYFRF